MFDVIGKEYGLFPNMILNWKKIKIQLSSAVLSMCMVS